MLYFPEAQAVGVGVPEDFWNLAACLQPVVLFAMPPLASSRRLPHILRFNLLQAFILDLLLCVAHCASALASLALAQTVPMVASPEALYVPHLTGPSLMPGGEVVCAVLAACVAYSVLCTLLGILPDGIPYVSGEATKSVGLDRDYRWRCDALRKLEADEAA